MYSVNASYKQVKIQGARQKSRIKGYSTLEELRLVSSTTLNIPIDTELELP